MEENEQQAFLRQAKEALGLTWDDLARASGIAPRALKTYRMPVTSQVSARCRGWRARQSSA
jgi:hypothetical protein